MDDINYDHVICPNCCHSFRAIPVNVQNRLAEMEAQMAEARDIVKKWAAKVRQALIDEILAEAKILNAEHPQSRTLGEWDSLLNEPNDWLARTAPKEPK